LRAGGGGGAGGRRQHPRRAGWRRVRKNRAPPARHAAARQGDRLFCRLHARAHGLARPPRHLGRVALEPRRFADRRGFIRLARHPPPGAARVIYESEELRETLRMIEAEHLDIRAVTMGISLRDCPTDELHATCARVYEKITRSAARLVAVAGEV